MKIEYCVVTETPLVVTFPDGRVDYILPLEIVYSADHEPSLTAYFKDGHVLKTVPISAFEHKPLSGTNADIVRFFYRAFANKTSPVALVSSFDEYCGLNRFKMREIG